MLCDPFLKDPMLEQHHRTLQNLQIHALGVGKGPSTYVQYEPWFGSRPPSKQAGAWASSAWSIARSRQKSKLGAPQGRNRQRSNNSKRRYKLNQIDLLEFPSPQKWSTTVLLCSKGINSSASWLYDVLDCIRISNAAIWSCWGSDLKFDMQ